MNCYIGLDFLLLTALTLVSSCLPTGTAQTLENESCKTRPTLIPIGPPSFPYFPYYVTLYRCGGSDDYNSPLYRTCMPATTQVVKIQVQDLYKNELKEITEKNHTSCKPECTNKKEMCDTEMEVWNEKECVCKCKYPNGPPESCPTRFKWNARTCSCECNEEEHATECPTSGKLWSSDKCGCECQPRIMSRCKRFNKVLDEETCTCVVGKVVFGASTGKNKESGVSKPLLVGIVFGELLLLLFIFDLILSMKKWGCMYYIHKSIRKTVSSDSHKSPPLSPSSYHGKTTYL